MMTEFDQYNETLWTMNQGIYDYFSDDTDFENHPAIQIAWEVSFECWKSGMSEEDAVLECASAIHDNFPELTLVWPLEDTHGSMEDEE